MDIYDIFGDYNTLTNEKKEIKFKRLKGQFRKGT